MSTTQTRKSSHHVFTSEEAKRANRTALRKKVQRAALRERVRSGELSVAEVIRRNPKVLIVGKNARPIPIVDILCWPKRARHDKAEEVLKRLRIPPTCQLHSLSDPRRKLLAKEVS